jgi:hypothetical protein
MPKYIATDQEDFEVIPPGLYEVEMKEIVEKAAFFANEDGEEERRKYYQWVLEIVNDEEFAGRWLFANVSDKFGPKSKQRQWVEAMIGRAIRRGEEFDTDDLIGGRYHATVFHKPGQGDKVWAEVNSLNKIRGRPKKKAATSDPEKMPPVEVDSELTEEELADMPDFSEAG